MNHDNISILLSTVFYDLKYLFVNFFLYFCIVCEEYFKHTSMHFPLHIMKK